MCPVCGAAMGVFESISYVDGTSSWSGICGECGVRVEGERPQAESDDTPLLYLVCETKALVTSAS